MTLVRALLILLWPTITATAQLPPPPKQPGQQMPAPTSGAKPQVKPHQQIPVVAAAQDGQPAVFPDVPTTVVAILKGKGFFDARFAESQAQSAKPKEALPAQPSATQENKSSAPMGNPAIAAPPKIEGKNSASGRLDVPLASPTP